MQLISFNKEDKLIQCVCEILLSDIKLSIQLNLKELPQTQINSP